MSEVGKPRTKLLALGLVSFEAWCCMTVPIYRCCFKFWFAGVPPVVDMVLFYSRVEILVALRHSEETELETLWKRFLSVACSEAAAKRHLRSLPRVFIDVIKPVKALLRFAKLSVITVRSFRVVCAAVLPDIT